MTIAKIYEPNQYEPTIYALWESSSVFAPTGVGEPYSVVMPPPNANGNLHIGHALMAFLEDIQVRFHRMNGRDAVYIPGADHAGFETWVVYEKELQKKQQSRFDFSREQLYSQVWNFVDQQRGNMELQLRALGAGASWENLVFTLDEKVIKTTHQTFQKLWDEGLIYRGERIVNYCTTHQTSFADIEVEHKNEKGKLYKVAYPTLDKIDEIIVATTRPETMLGDTAIAVHPDDERYKHLIGTNVLLPLVDKEIPIVGDNYVDSSYGTGAVKVTPAHDPNDFEIGKRHNLEEIQVIDFDGTMINVPSQFAGITALEARKRVLAALESQELRRGESTIEHAVGHCYKCGTVIQPLIKDQWFIEMKPLAEAAKAVINSGEVTFTPESKKKALLHYLDNIRDWNLSRQIPWGIPIPAFQNINQPDDWIFDERVEEQTITVNGQTYRREEDTFDTWFSSAQWPFITTDYLDEGELSRFYPLNLMETGHDILFPWVSRMLMLGLKMTGQVPFRHVYLHGLVQDEHGQKMSKSKGNVVNPMEAISEYGSDALRMGLVASRSAGQDQAFSTGKVVAGRNFCNKLWNVARYIENTLEDTHTLSAPKPKSLADHWIVSELMTARDKINSLLESHRYAEANEVVYHTLWSSVADWYVEASKSQEDRELLSWVLDTTLRLTHPFAPFVTETIWQTLPWYKQGTTLASAKWPVDCEYDEISAAEFGRLQKLVSEIRFVTSELPGNKKYSVVYGTDSLVEENKDLVAQMAHLTSVEFTEQPEGLRLAASGREAWLVVDKDTLYEHQINLERRLAEAHSSKKQLEGRLANKSYVDKAPAYLVEDTKKSLDDTSSLINRLVAELEVISPN